MEKLTIADKLFEFSTNNKVYCKNKKCSGHGVVFRNKNQDRILCPNCNEWIYRDEKTKLKYEMMKRGVSIDN